MILNTLFGYTCALCVITWPLAWWDNFFPNVDITREYEDMINEKVTRESEAYWEKFHSEATQAVFERELAEWTSRELGTWSREEHRFVRDNGNDGQDRGFEGTCGSPDRDR